MKLENKKALIARTLNVGKSRVVLNLSRLTEVKEAITKQDIKDLFADKAISIKEIKGRKKIVKRKTRRRAGSVKIKVKTRKQDYVKLTRKLRAHLKYLKDRSEISQQDYTLFRKQLRTKEFKSLNSLKERIRGYSSEVKK
jgi:large subunit ribosomal protein L19e